MSVKSRDLAANSVLTTASAEDLADLAACCERRTVGRGEHLYRRGDRPGEVAFQLSGTLRIMFELGKRRPLLLNYSGAHDGTTGLRDVLVGRPRTTSAIAQTPSVFAVLPAAAAVPLFARRPNLLWAALQEICLGLNRFARLAADIGVLDLPRQVATLLLDPTDKLPRRRESQEDLSARLGASRQSVNKALTMLRQRGWIERRDDGTFVVSQPAVVRRFVDGMSRPYRVPSRLPRREVNDGDWLARGPLLAAVTDDDARALRAVSRVASYRKGETIFREGDEPAHIAVLLEGRGLLTADCGGHGTYVYRTVEPDGATWGVNALLLDRPPAVTLRAQGHARVLEVPRGMLGAALLRAPAALWTAGREIATATTEFLQTAAELAVLSATGRVACVLLNHADADGDVTLSLTQRELAARVGLSRQSVNRALTQLRDDKLVEVNGTRYYVRDHAALHRFVYAQDE